ncbi:MAG: acyltransferase [Terracidiphilus sp.]|jgi:exopolysaccharide production protein ExoZ
MRATTAGVANARIADLQILRAVAASLVVVDHTIIGLPSWHFPYGRYLVAGDLCGALGVRAFFVLSGLIMVRQSAGRFGSQKGSLIFAWRRITRIVPMYWLATWLWLGTLMMWHEKLDNVWEQTALSLFFIPNFLSTRGLMLPILQPGWTLNFEMGFYLLFSLVLLLPESRGIGALLFSIVGMYLVGGRVHPSGSTAALLLQYYTDPIILLFAVGVLLGFLETRVTLGRWRFPISPALLLGLALALLFFPAAVNRRGFHGWGLPLSGFAVAVVLLCTLAKARELGRAGRVAVLLGDASYCTYLFHGWIYGVAVAPIAYVAAHLHVENYALPLFLIGCVIAANLLGLAVHLAIERPLTRLLQRVRFRSAREVAAPL